METLKLAVPTQPDFKIVPFPAPDIKIIEPEDQDFEAPIEEPEARIGRYRLELEEYNGISCRHCQEQNWRQGILAILQ